MITQKLNSDLKGIILLLICFVVFSCLGKKASPDELELLLDQIEQEASPAQVDSILGDFADVDWDNPIKYEQFCMEYKVLPKVDTFDFFYQLDFCNDDFNWVNKYEKKRSSQD